MEQITALMKLVTEAKTTGVNPTTVVARFCRRLVQPIKDRVHPSYEYEGPDDCTKEQLRYVRGGELRSRILSVLFTVEPECPARPPFSLANPAPPEQAVDFFSAAPLPEGDHRTLKVVEKTIPMSRRPATDDLVLESGPEDWFAETPETRKRKVSEPPTVTTGPRKRRAINKRADGDESEGDIVEVPAPSKPKKKNNVAALTPPNSSTPGSGLAPIKPSFQLRRKSSTPQATPQASSSPSQLKAAEEERPPHTEETALPSSDPIVTLPDEEEASKADPPKAFSESELKGLMNPTTEEGNTLKISKAVRQILESTKVIHDRSLRKNELLRKHDAFENRAIIAEARVRKLEAVDHERLSTIHEFEVANSALKKKLKAEEETVKKLRAELKAAEAANAKQEELRITVEAELKEQLKDLQEAAAEVVAQIVPEEPSVMKSLGDRLREAPERVKVLLKDTAKACASGLLTTCRLLYPAVRLEVVAEGVTEDFSDVQVEHA